MRQHLHSIWCNRCDKGPEAAGGGSRYLGWIRLLTISIDGQRSSSWSELFPYFYCRKSWGNKTTPDRRFFSLWNEVFLSVFVCVGVDRFVPSITLRLRGFGDSPQRTPRDAKEEAGELVVEGPRPWGTGLRRVWGKSRSPAALRSGRDDWVVGRHIDLVRSRSQKRDLGHPGVCISSRDLGYARHRSAWKLWRRMGNLYGDNVFNVGPRDSSIRTTILYAC
jgi:hypothetical protein